MKNIGSLIYLALATLALTITANPAYGSDKDVLFQFSTINALLEGVYDGEMTFGALSRRGSFGLGTFNRLDGEMVLLDGVVYRIRTDGKVYVVASKEKTPFAMATWFEEDKISDVAEPFDSNQLQAHIDTLIDSKNQIYAIKVSGSFKYLKLRSVPIQSKPYPKLSEVIANQAVFEHSNVRGTIVGFRMPASLKGANVAGYHFHFISENRKFGGHVLALKTGEVKIALDQTGGFMMVLPDGADFNNSDESEDTYQPMESATAR